MGKSKSKSKSEDGSGEDRLAEYRRKRSAHQTPEPFGAGAAHRSRLFVVQKHAARSMHYDLRLELGGVLHSWAVPKGPSLDPQAKRLAVQVEEHPVDYADFEGVIPEGNYGAGAVIVFDRGRWVSIGDPEEGLSTGKLLFDLWGHKLRGRWTLFRTKGGPKSWLLMKKPDAFADADGEVPQQSIFSGLTVEELRDGVDPARKIRSKLERLGAPHGRVPAQDLSLMLAETADAPFSNPDWLFELKYDGYRLIAARNQGRPFLRYRRGQEVTERFPEIASALRVLPYEGLVLDGELVVLDEQGKPSFAQLQRRVHVTRRPEVQRAAVAFPTTLFVFDLVACEGFDLRSLPLVERKSVLARLLPPAGPLRYAEHFAERGEAVFEEVGNLGFEGIVAKRADSPYQEGRSADWLKIRVDRTGDFAIVGFTRPKGSRSGIGALSLGVLEGEGLAYAGRVGTGFDARLLRDLHAALEPRRRKDPACSGAPADEVGHVWVEPELVCEVRYKEWTRAGHLRHPVFLRLREDKTVEQCDRRDPGPAPIEPDDEPAVSAGAGAKSAAERTVSFTNREKVFWPDDGYTKGDLIDYYDAVSDWLLPYLRDRPLVLTRYPDGINGKSFFQKDAPGFVPDWIRTEKMWSEHAEREIHYFVCEDRETLQYIANLGTIPLHLWSSRIGTLQHPDWCILDLDPKDAPFHHVVRVARAIHELCDEIRLESFVKTSGSTGLHVLLPLGGQCTYEQSRQLAEVLATVVAAEHAEVATLTRNVARRKGRVYIDYLQNGHGRLLVAPYSVRPLPGAPVSAPLPWSAVNDDLQIAQFTIRTLPPRLRRQKNDPWAGLLESVPDLEAALSRLAGRGGRKRSR